MFCFYTSRRMRHLNKDIYETTILTLLMSEWFRHLDHNAEKTTKYKKDLILAF